MKALALLLHGLDTAYDRKAWHGPTLQGTLRGVDEATYFATPLMNVANGSIALPGQYADHSS